MSDLHTGECIHGGYFVAGASIHTVGEVFPLAKVSVICSNKVTFQVKRSLNNVIFFPYVLLKITCHHLECLLCRFLRSAFCHPTKEVSPPRNAFDNKMVKINQRTYSVFLRVKGVGSFVVGCKKGFNVMQTDK